MGIFKPPYGSRLKLGHPLAKYFVGLWLMNERRGDKANSLVYNSLVQGTLDQLSSPTVFEKNWIEFPAAQYGKIDCGMSSILELQDMTIIAKVRARSLDSTSIVFSRSDLIASGGYEFGINDTNGLSFAYNDGSVRGWYTNTTVLPLNTWFTVAMTWSPARGSVIFYIDGVEKNTVNTVGNDIVHVSDTAFIGDQIQNYEWDGQMKYVYVLKKVLTSSEIKGLYINPGSVVEDPYPIELFASVTAEVGWTGIMDGITNPGKIDGISVANIKSINEIQ
jgi:hypothetical protein